MLLAGDELGDQRVTQRLLPGQRFHGDWRLIGHADPWLTRRLIQIFHQHPVCAAASFPWTADPCSKSRTLWALGPALLTGGDERRRLA